MNFEEITTAKGGYGNPAPGLGYSDEKKMDNEYSMDAKGVDQDVEILPAGEEKADKA